MGVRRAQQQPQQRVVFDHIEHGGRKHRPGECAVALGERRRRRGICRVGVFSSIAILNLRRNRCARAIVPLRRASSEDAEPPGPRAGPLRRRWRRFMALSPSDRLLFLELWSLLGGVSALLHLLDYQRTRQLLLHLLPATPRPPARPEDATSYALRVGRLVQIAGRHLPVDGSCLRQSLLVWWLLRRRGMPAELRIGVSKRDTFAAHAWVDLDGRPINDSADVAERFNAFDRLHRWARRSGL